MDENIINKEREKQIYRFAIKSQFIESGSKDINEWFNNQKEAKFFYKTLIENNGIIINTPTTVEIDKGIIDTISDKKTTIITPFTFTFKNRKNVIYKPSNYNEYNKRQWQGFDTIITQNPYTGFQTLDWLKKYFNQIKICIGVYGKISDYDKDKKIRMLKELVEEFKMSANIEYETENGYYASHIKFKQKEKKLGGENK